MVAMWNTCTRQLSDTIHLMEQFFDVLDLIGMAVVYFDQSMGAGHLVSSLNFFCIFLCFFLICFILMLTNRKLKKNEEKRGKTLLIYESAIFGTRAVTNMPMSLKNKILTSKHSAQHPFESQNIQQIILESQSGNQTPFELEIIQLME